MGLLQRVARRRVGLRSTAGMKQRELIVRESRIASQRRHRPRSVAVVPGARHWSRGRTEVYPARRSHQTQDGLPAAVSAPPPSNHVPHSRSCGPEAEPHCQDLERGRRTSPHPRRSSGVTVLRRKVEKCERRPAQACTTQEPTEALSARAGRISQLAVALTSWQRTSAGFGHICDEVGRRVNVSRLPRTGSASPGDSAVDVVAHAGDLVAPSPPRTAT